MQSKSVQVRRDKVIERISNSKNPATEIQRLASEFYTNQATIYRDLQAMNYPKKNDFRY